MTKARIAIDLKNFEIAQKHINSAQPLDKGYFNTLILARMLYYNKEYKKAIDLLKCFDDVENINEKTYPWLKNSFKYLAKAYSKVGDYKKSNDYYQHYISSATKFDKILDSISQTIRKGEIANFKKELTL